VSFAKKIVVTHCARAAYTASVPVHGTYTAVYTVRHGPYAAVYTRIRAHRRYKAVYAPYTRPCTRPVHSRIHGPCTRQRTRPVVYMAGRPTGHVHVPRRHATAVCGPSRPCTRPVHSPFTTVYTVVNGLCKTAVTRPSDTCIRLHRS